MAAWAPGGCRGDYKDRVCCVIERRNTPRNHTPVQFAALAVADLMAFFVAALLSMWVQWPGVGVPQEELTHFFQSRSIHFIAVTGWLIWFSVFKQTAINRKPFWAEAQQFFMAWLGFAALDLLLIGMFRGEPASGWWFGSWLIFLALVPIFRHISRRILVRFRRWNRSTVIVGNGPNALRAFLALQSEPQMGYVVIGFALPASVTSTGAMTSAPVQGLPFMVWDDETSLPQDMVHLHFVIALEADQGAQRDAMIFMLNRHGVDDLHVIPAMAGVPLYGQDTLNFFSHEVLLICVNNKLDRPLSRFTKRFFDIFVASTVIVLTLPVMAYVALRIWREDGGPFIFTQRRVGKHGVEFNIFKFRSMVKNADDMLMAWKANNSSEWQRYYASNFKLDNDPRILKIGSLIRRTSLDELPQLFNVLRGEMSLVGPRPLLARELGDYGSDIALYHLATPGLTGVWQVSGRSATKFSARADFDAWYVKNWSVWMDIVILFKTVSVLYKRTGAL